MGRVAARAKQFPDKSRIVHVLCITLLFVVTSCLLVLAGLSEIVTGEVLGTLLGVIVGAGAVKSFELLQRKTDIASR